MGHAPFLAHPASLHFTSLPPLPSNQLFYAYKCSFNMSMWAFACLAMYFSSSSLVHVISALTMGLFWQQCGWLAHDFLHHQVFKQRKYGDLGGIFWGNLMQGYSMQWWKNKHNGHHAVPNLHNTSVHTTDGDPDIDTMPLLAWSLKQARSFRELHADGKDGKLVKFFIKWQAFTYFPILLLARISWLNESAKTAFGIAGSSKNAQIELERKGIMYPKVRSENLIEVAVVEVAAVVEILRLSHPASRLVSSPRFSPPARALGHHPSPHLGPRILLWLRTFRCRLHHRALFSLHLLLRFVPGPRLRPRPQRYGRLRR